MLTICISLYIVVSIVVATVIIARARKRMYLDGDDLFNISAASLLWLPIALYLALAKIGSKFVYLINHPSKR